MFENQADTFIDLKKLQLLGIYQSLNQPQISPEPNVSPEPATCFFILVETQGDQLFLFVGLHFFSSGHRILYRTPSFLPEEAPERLAHAEAFAGEMGFMMDDLHFSAANAAEKSEMLRTIVFFYKDNQTFLQALSSSEREVKQTQAAGNLTRETKAEQYSYFLEQYVTILSML